MKIKRMLLAVLVVVGLLIPCFTEAQVDIALYWNYPNPHYRAFKALEGFQPPNPECISGTNWVRADGYFQTRDGVNWYTYTWSFCTEAYPDVRARTAFGHDSTYMYDGYDKFFSPPNAGAVIEKNQMFYPYKKISYRNTNIGDITPRMTGNWRYQWNTIGWYDWTLGTVFPDVYDDQWGVNDIWSGSVTYNFYDGTSKTWTGDFIELIETEKWGDVGVDIVYHLMKGRGLIAGFNFPHNDVWPYFLEAQQNGRLPYDFSQSTLIWADAAYR